MTLGTADEFERIRASYEKRDAEMPYADWRTNIYHQRHPVGHFFAENNRSALLRALNALEIELDGERVLDVGCGSGAWLRNLVELSAAPSNLTGIDLSRSRLEMARMANPAIEWIHYGGGALPLPDRAFTLVMQIVVFSSILDEDVRARLASEMLRVTTPGGRVLWIDLKTGSAGRLEGFPDEKVICYFPGCRVVHRDDVQPAYARNLRWPAADRAAAWAQLRYAWSRRACESTLLVLEKVEG